MRWNNPLAAPPSREVGLSVSISVAYAMVAFLDKLMSSSAQLASPVQHALGQRTRWRAGKYLFVVVLIAWLYFPVLLRLVHQWYEDPNYSHGFLVPVFSAFVVFRQRESLQAAKVRPSAWGLPLLVLGVAILIVGVLGAELFLSRVSLLVVLAGVMVFFFGWSTLRLLLFPWLFLLLMVPIPTIVLSRITFPLQMLTSVVSGSSLPLFGVPVLREGNIINLPALPLEVAEACSGIRSLLSLLTLATIYGFLAEKRVGVRILLALSSIPVAVAANSARIVVTGLLAQYWNTDNAQGFFHGFSGWLIFLMSIALLTLLHRLVRSGEGRHNVI